MTDRLVALLMESDRMFSTILRAAALLACLLALGAASAPAATFAHKGPSIGRGVNGPALGAQAQAQTEASQPRPEASPAPAPPPSPSPRPAKGRYVIGFSQATTTEPWRILFNKELRDEAAKHPDVELIVLDGMDKVEKQVADMEELINRKVDAILISPKVGAGLTPVALKAMDAGIPVFVLDRSLETDAITQFIGADNQIIGRMAGEYAVQRLGGPGKARGAVVELWGGMGTQAAHDRHQGFWDVVGREPGVKLLGKPIDGDWKQDRGFEIMSQALAAHGRIDLVYAHNDPMAYGAYLAARSAGREKEPIFIGVDAIPAEGVAWTHAGVLSATFLYPTPGAEALRQAVALLKGEPIPRRVTLPTMRVDKSNAADILKAHGLLK